jgi:hypothetical protein
MLAGCIVYHRGRGLRGELHRVSSTSVLGNHGVVEVAFLAGIIEQMLSG